MSLPNKLFDFMHAGLPMGVTARKEVAAIVKDCGLGVVVEYATPAVLKAAVAEGIIQRRLAHGAVHRKQGLPLGCGRASD